MTADFQIHGDIVELYCPDTFQLGDAERMFELLAEVRRDHPRAFLMARAEGPGMTTDARKYILEWFKASASPLECTVYSAGPIQRVILEMIQRAADFLSPGKMILTAFRTRDEAVAWIGERRLLPLSAQPAV